MVAEARCRRHSGTHEPGNSEIVTFSDLVRAHRAWEVELYERERHNRQPDKTIEREFHRKWRQFEGRYGHIDDAYWSVRDASAVALTMGQKDSRWLSRPEHVPRFHRATDWATRDEPETAAALDECETLAIRVEEILRGPSELIALRRINAVASHLLGSVDREWGRRPAPAAGRRTPDRTHLEEDKARIELQRRELERVERFYDRAGNGQARILFFWGMAQGLLALVVLTAIAVALTWRVDGLDGGGTHWGELQLFVISVTAGASVPSSASSAYGIAHGEVRPRPRDRAQERALDRHLPTLRGRNLRDGDVPHARERDPADAEPG